jgi:RsiW-degrading membrane proteinase PrsW (M82 family)
MEVIVLALAVAAPFLLWPAEILLPYPHFLEEILKLVLVLLILERPGPFLRKVVLCLASGALFTLSESILYFLGIFQIGQPALFFQRLALTIPLHVGTMMLMLLPASLSQGGSGLKKKELVIIGFLLAILLHYLYNLAVGEYFKGLLH